MCKREFSISNFKLRSYWQNIDFSRNCPEFYIITKIKIFKYNCNFLDQLLLPYDFHGNSMRGIILFSFASGEPLTSGNLMFHRNKGLMRLTLGNLLIKKLLKIIW